MGVNDVANPLVLLATSTKTASFDGDAVDIRRLRAASLAVVLDVSAHAGTTPTLDLRVQGSYDGGTNFTDIAAFTRVTETDGRRYLVITPIAPSGVTTATADWAEQDGALAAGTTRSVPAPTHIRAKGTITGAGASYTLAVHAVVRP